MLKTMQWAVLLFCGLNVFVQGADPKSKEEVIKGTPWVVRTNPVTEVFFHDLPTPYMIPEGGPYNRIMNAVQAAIKSKTAIGLRVNPKTKNILGLEGDPAPASAPAAADDEEKTEELTAEQKAAIEKALKELKEAKPGSKKKPAWQDL